MVNTYAVSVGDELWTALYNHIDNEVYSIDSVFEEDGNLYSVLKERNGDKYYRLDFSLTEAEGFVSTAELVEMVEYTPLAEPQFSLEAVEAFENEYHKAEEPVEEEVPAVETEDETEEVIEEVVSEEVVEEAEKPAEETTEEEVTEEVAAEVEEVAEDETEEETVVEEEQDEVKYNLEEVVEYNELQTEYAALEAKYAELETNYNAAIAEKVNLNTELESLRAFKANVERKQKEEMIQSFYMLSDEDKEDVVNNIDSYSVDDIEAKLSIICVRNKVSFNLDENIEGPTAFNLNSINDVDDSIPAWLKASLATEKAMKD